MRSLYSIFLLAFLNLSCITRKTSLPIIANIRRENFDNNGEREDFEAAKLFEESYKKGDYKKYKGTIKFLDANHIAYGNTFLEIYDYPDELQPLFAEGVFYPRIFKTDTLRISFIAEQPFLSSSPKIKRYKFWRYTQGLLNPTVYFIEVTNIKATPKTTLREFFKGCKLTFVKEGWLVI